jgi:hypothetical protein
MQGLIWIKSLEAIFRNNSMGDKIRPMIDYLALLQRDVIS